MSVLSLDLSAMPITVPRRAITLDGFVDWATSDDFPQAGHISYIDGQIIIDMCPADAEYHQLPVIEVTTVLRALVRKLDLGELYGDRTLLVNRQADISTEPDAVFASWEALRSGRLKYERRRDDGMAYLAGTPDWVLEAVSPGSVKKDATTLREKYHNAGIPEYWLLDARGEEINLQVLVRESREYVAVRPVKGWLTSRVFPRRFRLERERNRVGHWSYTLLVKPL